MELDEDEFRAQCRKDYRTPEWHAYSLKTCAKRGHRCQRCGRRGVRLVVHHRYYLRGLRLWEYDDEAVEVVCASRCHREADRDREDQNRLDRIRKEFGPEALKHVSPHQSELRKLAQVETPFKQWLIDSGVYPGIGIGIIGCTHSGISGMNFPRTSVGT